MKIRSKILVSYLTTIVAFILIVITIFYVYVSKNLSAVIFNQLESLAESKASHIETYLDGVRGRMEDFASDGKIRDCAEDYISEGPCNFETLQEHLIINKLPIIDDLYQLMVIDLEGNVINSTETTNYNFPNFYEEDIFTNSLEESYIGEVFHDENFDIHAFYVAAPLFTTDESRELIGVIVGEISTDKLYEILATRTGLHETSETYLINRDQIMISPSRFIPGVILDQEVLSANADLCFSEAVQGRHVLGQEIGSFLDYKGDIVLGTHRFIPVMDWCLLSEVDESDARAELTQLYILALVVVGGIMFSSIAVSISIGAMISGPIEILSKGMRQIEHGDLDAKIAMPMDDELGQLSQAMQRMTRALKESQSEVGQKVKEQTTAILDQKQRLEEQQQAILNILEDVEEEKERAEAFALDLEKFKLAVENASDMIVITDPDGKVVHTNKSIVEVTGYDFDEIKNKDFIEVVGREKNKDVIADILKDMNSGVKTLRSDLTAVRKDGSEFEMALSSNAILDANKKVQFVVFIARDITKEKKVDAMKTEFISLASHQLRTPLSSMRWFCEMLLDGDAGELTDEQTEFIQNINDSNQRMIALVNALLNISRIESGRIIIDPEPVDIKDLIDDVLLELQPRILEKKHHVITSINEKLGKISLDPKLIAEVYKNLLTNAIKYTPEGGEISIFVSEKDNQVISQVSDNGYGIPQDDLSNIFNKFYRAENIVQYDTDGNGLGLYLIKAIIESSGGEINVDSKIGEGSSFIFTLPKRGMKEKSGEVRLS